MPDVDFFAMHKSDPDQYPVKKKDRIRRSAD
jgi:hypothetical protein